MSDSVNCLQLLARVFLRTSVTRNEYRLGAAEAFASALVHTAEAFQLANDDDKHTEEEDEREEDEQEEEEQEEEEQL